MISSRYITFPTVGPIPPTSSTLCLVNENSTPLPKAEAINNAKTLICSLAPEKKNKQKLPNLPNKITNDSDYQKRPANATCGSAVIFHATVVQNTLFVTSLTKLVSSRPRDSSETFLLGKLVRYHAQSPAR